MKPRHHLLIGIAIVSVLIVANLDPIAQDPAYHDFADERTLFGIPNFWNVSSNLPFAVVGLAGMFALWRGELPRVLPQLRWPYFVFFLGTLLVAFGSGFYHLFPSTPFLFWDRLPMSIAFMALVAILVGEYFDPVWGRESLLPLLCVGMFSVLLWRVTEARHEGDLRLYALVQFLPMILIPVVLSLFPSRVGGSGWIWAMLGCYLLAKLLEAFDKPIFAGLGEMSGHALKHLAAAAGTWLFYLRARSGNNAHRSSDAHHPGEQLRVPVGETKTTE